MHGLLVKPIFIQTSLLSSMNVHLIIHTFTNGCCQALYNIVGHWAHLGLNVWPNLSCCNGWCILTLTHYPMFWTGATALPKQFVLFYKQNHCRLVQYISIVYCNCNNWNNTDSLISNLMSCFCLRHLESPEPSSDTSQPDLKSSHTIVESEVRVTWPHGSLFA